MKAPGGNLRNVGAPYSAAFVNPGATNLTTQIEQCRNGTSGALVIATAAASAFSYKDCAGNTIALTGLAAGAYDLTWVAMSEIVSSTTCIVLVGWHGTTSGI